VFKADIHKCCNAEFLGYWLSHYLFVFILYYSSCWNYNTKYAV